jgi:hypothetical protein
VKTGPPPSSFGTARGEDAWSYVAFTDTEGDRVSMMKPAADVRPPDLALNGGLDLALGRHGLRPWSGARAAPGWAMHMTRD